ncbi:MAG: hypothetical protein AAGD12_14475 [Pseudomonadota bacterium]
MTKAQGSPARRRGVGILFGAWAALWVWSLIYLALGWRSGSSLAGAIGLGLGFLVWQALAAVLAVAVWIAGRRLTGRDLWLSRLPLALALLLVLLLGLALLLGARAADAPEVPPVQPASARHSSPAERLA